MSNVIREDGFYFIKFYQTARWEILEWTNDYDGVWLIGDRNKEGFICDDDIHEINETKIKVPE